MDDWAPSHIVPGTEVNSFDNFSPESLLDNVPLERIEHFGRPLKAHLSGTYDLLLEWCSSEPVCLAGLLHSIYSTRTFTQATLEISARSQVQKLIGTEAEQLVYLFCVSDRKRLLLENPLAPFSWVDHRTGERHSLPLATLQALVEIEAANFLEQLHLVDSPEIIGDMQTRFESSGHLLSEPAKRALRIRLAAAQFARSGCGTARKLLGPDEVDPLIKESMALWHRFRGGGASNLRIGIRLDRSGRPLLERLDPVSDISPLFHSLNGHASLLSIAELGLGGSVRVMKEKLIYKWPGTPGFGSHRDGQYNTPRTGIPGSEALTICLALARADQANGALELFPSLRTAVLAAPPKEPRDIAESELAGVESVMPVMEPGDAVIFDGQVPHRSGWNHSDAPRLTYMVTFVPERYASARDDYYNARRREQGEDRHHLLSEPLFFE